MDSKEKAKEKGKSKSPSKKARDNRRLIKWLKRKMDTRHETEGKYTKCQSTVITTTLNKSTQVYLGELIYPNSLDTNKIFSIPYRTTDEKSTQVNTLTFPPKYHNSSQTTSVEAQTYPHVQTIPTTIKPVPIKHPHPQTTPPEEDPTKSKPHSYNKVSPKDVYSDIETNLTMTRLEETKNLTKALRYVVRHLHNKGKTVRFPSPEAVDRLELKIAGLPTNPTELWGVIQKVFKRRDENIVLQDLYADFVTTHGRKAFDPSKTSSDCFYISYNP